MPRGWVNVDIIRDAEQNGIINATHFREKELELLLGQLVGTELCLIGAVSVAAECPLIDVLRVQGQADGNAFDVEIVDYH